MLVNALIVPLFVIIFIHETNCDTVKKKDNEQKEMLNKLKKKQLVTKIMSKPEDCTVLSEVGDEVLVHYTGYLEDGTIFDSSEKLNKDPISFKIGDGMVIQGWERGLTGMCENEKRRLVIPPELAYGQAGFPPVIPADATLMFEVTLVSLTKNSQASLLTDPFEIIHLVKLLAAPFVVICVFIYLYKKYHKETGEAKGLKKGKKASKRK